MLRRSLSAYALLAVPLAVLFLFTLLPTVAGLALSLFRWDGGQPPRFVGADNFRLLLDDPRFLPSLWNTLRYTFFTVPLTVAFGFLLALALHAKWFRGKIAVRTAIFLPTIVSIVAIGFVWRWLLDDQGGLVPSLYSAVVHQLELGSIRPSFLPLRPPSMLQDGDWPMRWVMVVTVWRGVGFCMVLYLASLAGIPDHLYEAAAVDGASDREMVRHITWPMVTPMTVFLLITGVISALQVFDIVWAMTAGTETASTRVLNLFVYREFQQSRLGYAAALGAIIFVLTLGATALQVAVFRRAAEPEGAA
jgi:multiple sugar transport system permease protein